MGQAIVFGGLFGSARGPRILHEIVRGQFCFDRVAPFPQPSLPLRRIYLERLMGDALEAAGAEADVAGGLSFAQIGDAFILSPHLVMGRFKRRHERRRRLP